ncbi:MAG: DUF4276 family protein [Firmicutes bacterium]|nr:DUF4276 family protein [Bacillota bacterium]
MHIEFLVEEESAEAALNRLVPKIIGNAATYRIHTFRGKQDLLAKLPTRLRGYASWLPPDWRIVVLIDEDRADCKKLKEQLEKAAEEAGLTTKSMARTRNQPRVFNVANRIAVEKLESWFFGDVEAIVLAYPRVSGSFAQKAAYRDPDAIRGGTAQRLERILQQAGYHSEGLAKIEAACRIAEHTEPQRNRSHSFQVFRRTLLDIIGAQTSGPDSGLRQYGKAGQAPPEGLA